MSPFTSLCVRAYMDGWVLHTCNGVHVGQATAGVERTRQSPALILPLILPPIVIRERGEWSLVCNNLEDWQDLVQKLKVKNKARNRKMRRMPSCIV